MESKTFVEDLNGWLKLPQIETVTITDQRESGNILDVQKVGIVLADKNECVKRDIKTPEFMPGKSALPTAMILLQGKDVLFRLPVELSDWAKSCVQMAHSGANPFPARVDFGVFNGRFYAEIL